MAEDAAPAFGMLLELDSQARELGISVPALEGDEFAGEFAISSSVQSAARTAADAVLLLHQRAERAQLRRLQLVALLQAAVSRAGRAPRLATQLGRSRVEADAPTSATRANIACWRRYRWDRRAGLRSRVLR